jgi:hypothetical protein
LPCCLPGYILIQYWCVWRVPLYPLCGIESPFCLCWISLLNILQFLLWFSPLVIT